MGLSREMDGLGRWEELTHVCVCVCVCRIDVAANDAHRFELERCGGELAVWSW